MTTVKERKKNYASSKKLLTSIKEKGPLGERSPFTRKEKGGHCDKYSCAAVKNVVHVLFHCQDLFVCSPFFSQRHNKLCHFILCIMD